MLIWSLKFGVGEISGSLKFGVGEISEGLKFPACHCPSHFLKIKLFFVFGN